MPRHTPCAPTPTAVGQHYSVEVVVASAESLRLLRYPCATKPVGVIYLLYTGQHYDPLLGP